MGNLYRLNSLFELEINSPELVNENKYLLDRSSVYEYLFLAISQKEDFVLVSENVSTELLEYWKSNNLTFGNTVYTDNPYYTDKLKLGDTIPTDLKLIEWGSISYFDNVKNILIKKQTKIDFTSSINSKINQTRWKNSVNENKLNSIICTNIEELDYCVSKFQYPFIIKPEFSFSGRGNILVKSESELKKISNKLKEIILLNKNGVVIEEWVGDTRKIDFSGLFDLSRSKSKLIAITNMLIDKNGVYRGTIISDVFGSEFIAGMKKLISHFQIKNHSYVGMISMDGFVFSRQKLEEIQYMSEVNFRYSMGRILFELHHKIGSQIPNYALLFLSIKSKKINFLSAIASIEEFKIKHKLNILILTPLYNAKSKLNSFVGLYVSSETEISTEKIEKLKSLFN